MQHQLHSVRYSIQLHVQQLWKWDGHHRNRYYLNLCPVSGNLVFQLLNYPFASFQLRARRMRSLPLLTVQPMRLWFRGAASLTSTHTQPILRMKKKDFSAAALSTPAAAYPTWNAASCTLSLSATMTEYVPVCLLSPFIWSQVAAYDSHFMSV